jgi:hypothetical protein
MSTAPNQAHRVGKFTASSFSTLMTLPRSLSKDQVEQFAHLVPVRYKELKSGPRKGQTVEIPGYAASVLAATIEQGVAPFGEAGHGYITAKAIERVTGVAMDESGGDSWGSRRGLMLEPAALFLLRDMWHKCSPCTWQQLGDNLGSTPDALIKSGTEPMDLKCPVNPADVVRFGLDVPDGDFAALLAWNPQYAWQIMVQALTCGSRTAHLVYFTDMLPIIKPTAGDLLTAQALIDEAAEKHSEGKNFPWSYRYASDGFFFVARSFELTDDICTQILSTLERAEVECRRIERDVRHLIQTGI